MKYIIVTGLLVERDRQPHKQGRYNDNELIGE